jgi:hypothetical protein
MRDAYSEGVSMDKLARIYRIGFEAVGKIVKETPRAPA